MPTILRYISRNVVGDNLAHGGRTRFRTAAVRFRTAQVSNSADDGFTPRWSSLTAAPKLARAYTDAAYFQRNLRTIDVLIDRDAVRAGVAPGDASRFYDLGHGYRTYDFSISARIA